MKKLFVCLLSLTLLFSFSYAEIESNEFNIIEEENIENNIESNELILFTMKWCQHCNKQKRNLETLQSAYNFTVKEYVASDNIDLFNEYQQKFNTYFNWVPILIYWDTYLYWDDFDSTEKFIQNNWFIKTWKIQEKIKDFPIPPTYIILIWMIFVLFLFLKTNWFFEKSEKKIDDFQKNVEDLKNETSLLNNEVKELKDKVDEKFN